MTEYGFGITPAYAGNTKQILKRKEKREDHPRLRGEHNFLHRIRQQVVGSPPPTRGTLGTQRQSRNAQGITPAYAGNTNKGFKILDQSQDHPRLRGEHIPFSR